MALLLGGRVRERMAIHEATTCHGPERTINRHEHTLDWAPVRRPAATLNPAALRQERPKICAPDPVGRRGETFASPAFRIAKWPLRDTV